LNEIQLNEIQKKSEHGELVQSKQAMAGESYETHAKTKY
jgi:hypothetical protein